MALIEPKSKECELGLTLGGFRIEDIFSFAAAICPPTPNESDRQSSDEIQNAGTNRRN